MDVNVLFFADLAQAIHQERAFDLLANFFLEAGSRPVFAERGQCPKARYGGRRHHLAVGIVQIAVDIFARDTVTVTCRSQALGLSTCTSRSEHQLLYPSVENPLRLQWSFCL